jgi:hypothetical protein
MKRKTLDKVQLVKALSRERVKCPRPQSIPNKKRRELTPDEEWRQFNGAEQETEQE